jgi:hypothetical protein
MNQGFQKRFGELVEQLAAVHGVFPSKALASGIWKVMQVGEVTDDECEAAFDRALCEWEKWHPPAVLRALAYSERKKRDGLLHPVSEPAPYRPEKWAEIRDTLKSLSESMELPSENLDQAKADAKRRLQA